MKKVSLLSAIAFALLVITSGCVTRPYVYSKGVGAVLQTTNINQLNAVVAITGNAAHADAARGQAQAVWCELHRRWSCREHNNAWQNNGRTSGNIVTGYWNGSSIVFQGY